MAAVSTGHCNSLLQFLSWRQEAQGLSWSFVELTGDLVELTLREGRQVHALGEVLPQQPIGVFVAAPLPRTGGIAEVDRHVGCKAEVLVPREFLAAVPSQGLAQLRRQPAYNAFKRRHDRLGL